jgi:hypothetical protein
MNCSVNLTQEELEYLWRRFRYDTDRKAKDILVKVDTALQRVRDAVPASPIQT